MTDDIETLRAWIKSFQFQSIDGFEVATFERLVAERDALRKALDDRFAADQKAAKAIFAETGRTSGFPSVKEVVAWYVAEVERLEKSAASWKRLYERAKEVLKPFANAANNMDKVRDDRPLWAALNSAWAQRDTICLVVADLRRAASVLAELSADAPAQQTQISDEAREAMVDAKDALALLLDCPEIADADPRDKDEETHTAERKARAALAKLRSVIK